MLELVAPVVAAAIIGLQNDPALRGQYLRRGGEGLQRRRNRPAVDIEHQRALLTGLVVGRVGDDAIGDVAVAFPGQRFLPAQRHAVGHRLQAGQLRRRLSGRRQHEQFGRAGGGGGREGDGASAADIGTGRIEPTQIKLCRLAFLRQPQAIAGAIGAAQHHGLAVGQPAHQFHGHIQIGRGIARCAACCRGDHHPGLMRRHAIARHAKSQAAAIGGQRRHAHAGGRGQQRLHAARGHIHPHQPAGIGIAGGRRLCLHEDQAGAIGGPVQLAGRTGGRESQRQRTGTAGEPLGGAGHHIDRPDVDRLARSAIEEAVISHFEPVFKAGVAGLFRLFIGGGKSQRSPIRCPRKLRHRRLAIGQLAGIAAIHRQHMHLRAAARVLRQERDAAAIGRPARTAHAHAAAEHMLRLGRHIDQGEFAFPAIVLQIGAGKHAEHRLAIRRQLRIADAHDLGQIIGRKTPFLRQRGCRQQQRECQTHGPHGTSRFA